MTTDQPTTTPDPGDGPWFSAAQEAENATRGVGADPHGLASLLPWPPVSPPPTAARRRPS